MPSQRGDTIKYQLTANHPNIKMHHVYPASGAHSMYYNLPFPCIFIKPMNFIHHTLTRQETILDTTNITFTFLATNSAFSYQLMMMIGVFTLRAASQYAQLHTQAHTSATPYTTHTYTYAPDHGVLIPECL